MQGGADAGIGVKGIDKGNEGSQNVVSFKNRGPQVLPAGVDDVAGHGNDLGNDDKGLQLTEFRRIIEQRIGQRAKYEEVPADIKNHKKLVKGDEIVEGTVDGMAFLRRDQVLRNEIHGEVKDPAAEKLDMGKSRLVEPAQGKAAVIIRFFLHAKIPLRGYSWGNPFWGCWDRARRCARAGTRPCG